MSFARPRATRPTATPQHVDPVADNRRASAAVAAHSSRIRSATDSATKAATTLQKTSVRSPIAVATWLLLSDGGGAAEAPAQGMMQLALCAARSTALCDRCAYGIVAPRLCVVGSKTSWMVDRTLCPRCGAPERGIDEPLGRRPVSCGQSATSAAVASTTYCDIPWTEAHSRSCKVLSFSSPTASLADVVNVHGRARHVEVLRVKDTATVLANSLALLPQLKQLVLEAPWPSDTVGSRGGRGGETLRTTLASPLPSLAALSSITLEGYIAPGVWESVATRLPSLTAVSLRHAFLSPIGTTFRPLNMLLLKGIPRLKHLALIDCAVVVEDVQTYLLSRSTVALTSFERHNREFDERLPFKCDVSVHKVAIGMQEFYNVSLQREADIFFAAISRSHMTRLKLDAAILFGSPLSFWQLPSAPTLVELDIAGGTISKIGPSQSWANMTQLQRLALNDCDFSVTKGSKTSRSVDFELWAPLSTLPRLQELHIRAKDGPATCHALMPEAVVAERRCCRRLTALDMSGRSMSVEVGRALLQVVAPHLQHLRVNAPGLRESLAAEGIGGSHLRLSDRECEGFSYF